MSDSTHPAMAIAAARKASISTTLNIATPPTSPPLTPRTISELISHRAQQAPDHAILGYPSQGVEYVEYTFAQLDRFATNGASYYSKKLPLRLSSEEPERVVALLGPSSLNYFVTVLALTRLGFTILFLSTRISEAAYLSLLEATSCTHMVVDPAFQKQVDGIRRVRPEVKAFNVLQRSDFEADTMPLTTSQQLNLHEESKKISWIIHSSGSTGLPKPIYQTHSAALRNYENNMNMEGFITLPLFHAHGISSVFRGLTSYKKIYMYNASLPLTSQYLLDILRQHKFEIFYGVPYALKLLSESSEGIDVLATMKVVMFGGSACPDGLGNLLVDGGVNLISHYGTTETGQLMTSFRPKGDKAWNYVRVHDALRPFVRFEPRGGNLFELVVLEGWPSKVATNREDGGYATKDLFEPHPSTKEAWKYGGRLDDTIVLVNGEKAIPLALEGAVRQQAQVKDAVVFGSGRTRLGMMVIASDAASKLSAQELIEQIWPTIAIENEKAPAYAQLTPESLIVLPSSTVYPQTDKGTLIRQAFYKSFSTEIDAFYTNLESAASGTLTLEGSPLREYLKNKILEIAAGLDENDLADDTDLFSLGVDSLQSTRLRATILKEVQLNGRALSQNFVFENPSVTKLAEAILALRKGATQVVKNAKQEMSELVAKYGNFPQFQPRPRVSANRCVIVTGASGSLGAHVVAQLVSRPDITEVCCLVRARSSRAALNRVISSMQARSVYHSLPLEGRRKITAYPIEQTRTDLGLEKSVYERLTQDLVSIIHCAWSVNFNKKLSSFEDCISGAKNLMLMCLSTVAPKPASFNFCSSVSTVANTPANEKVPEGLPPSFDYAQGMGYAQSKLVTENLVAHAAAQTGMNARVLRVGQIYGDRNHGIWNDTEAIPLMLQAAVSFGALPTLDENPQWLTVDDVATAVMDASLSNNKSNFYNIVNPASFHWTRDLLPKLRLAGLRFEEVGQREWIRRLRASNPDPVVNPTYKLVEFFASKYDNDVLKRKSLVYDTTETELVSPTIAARPQLTEGIVQKFVNYFLSGSWSAGVPKTARLIVLSGPCGCGKSTLAGHIAERLDCPLIEGDAVHDAIAVTKMSSGIPLSPLDREIWLSRIRVQVLERIRASQILRHGMGPDSETNVKVVSNIVLTCSALKREHRDGLRRILKDGSIVTQFVALQANESELTKRVEGRIGHYMKSNMVKSQLAAIESPLIDEADVLPMDTEGVSPSELADDLITILGS